MPFVFFLLGLLLVVIAIQGTQGQAFSMLKSEFTGSNNFVVFAAAIVILGALAYIKPIRPIAFAMIGLVVLAMILANKGGFFAQLNAAIRNPVTPNPVPSLPVVPAGDVGAVAPNAPTIYPGVPLTPFFRTPVTPTTPYA